MLTRIGSFFHRHGRLAALSLILALALLPWQGAWAQVPVGAGDADAYVEAAVDKSAPYIGEELTYLFRYYEAVDALRLPNMLVGQPDYDAPEFANFWQEGEITQINYQQNVNNRLYNVSELHTTIFPTAAGDMTIPPAKLILDGGFSGRRVELSTLPVTVAVQALPGAGATMGAGAVGDYTIRAQVDSTETQVDEPITLQITLEGTGNIRLAPDLPTPQLDGWRVLDQGKEVTVQPRHSLSTDSSEPLIGGTRTVKYLLIPSEAGEFTLPAMEYLFFDPILGEVKGAFTEPITFQVSAAPGSVVQSAAAAPVDALAMSADPAAANAAAGEPAIAAAPMAMVAPNDAASDSFINVSADMAPLVVGTLRQATSPLTQQTWFWALWGLPIVAIGVAAWAAGQSSRAQVRKAKTQRARAGSDALRAMHGQHTASPADMVGAAQRALTDFLGRKLNQGIAALPRPTLAAMLVDKGVQPNLAQQVVDCMRMGDMARFSPAGVDAYSAMQMQATVEATIRDLDRVL